MPLVSMLSPSTIRENGRDRRCDFANVDRLSICPEVFRERCHGWFRQRVANRQQRKNVFDQRSKNAFFAILSGSSVLSFEKADEVLKLVYCRLAAISLMVKSVSLNLFRTCNR